MKKEPKNKDAPKGETPFGRFEQLAKKVVTAQKQSAQKGDLKKN